MLIVAGLSLKNLRPRVWDPASPYYLPGLRAVMVSYADFHRMPARRDAAMAQGLRQFLGVPAGIRIYLDNGAFYFLGHGGETPREEYAAFVAEAGPDWWPIPQDYIPVPMMGAEEQRACFVRTMEVNRAYRQDGYTPVVHIGPLLRDYIVAIRADEQLAAKASIALGAIVPNLLRAPKAIPYRDVLRGLKHIRATFAHKEIHVFGIGGTATLHLAGLLGMDSVDSSGWRNRAARGIVQLPGIGDRVVANLGNWRGREPSSDEWELLAECRCPACQKHGIDGLKASLIAGFCNRATHNLWILLEEARWIEGQLARGTYEKCYKEHLVNSTYLGLIDQVLEMSARQVRLT